MTEVNQIPLDLKHTPSYAREDFIVSGSNSAAYTLVENTDQWLGHVAAIVGPPSCGKSHLAISWAREKDALVFDDLKDISSIKSNSFILVEDADLLLKEGHITEDQLFHLYNWTKEKSCRLLLTASSTPTKWDVRLPDLKSRLATVQIGGIGQPDDNLITVLLIKLFADRQLSVDTNVIHYITNHAARSFSAIYHIVDTLDKEALSEKKKITIPLVKRYLSSEAA